MEIHLCLSVGSLAVFGRALLTVILSVPRGRGAEGQHKPPFRKNQDLIGLERVVLPYVAKFYV